MSLFHPISARHALRGAGRSLLALATVSAAVVYAKDDAETAADAEAAPRLVITEFLPTTVGSDAGHEWIELANAGLADTSLAGYQLIDGKEASLHVFGADAKLPAGHSALVFLGPQRPGVAQWLNTTPDLEVFFTGQDPQDLLGDETGGLALLDPHGSIVDVVIYGADDTASSQPLAELATDSGAWTGGYVNAGPSGPSPSHPGGSIGRSRYAVDTDAPEDFAGDGGPDGAGCSPGAPNTVDVMNFNRLLFHAQDVANSAFFAYSMTSQQMGRFQVVSSDLNLVQPTDYPGLGYEVSALHSFDVIDSQGSSVPQEWVGMLSARFEGLDLRGYRMVVKGSLSSSNGETLLLDSDITLDGFGSTIHRKAQENNWELTLASQAYPLGVTCLETSTLNGAGQVTTDIHRTETNWDGQGPRDYSIQAVRTRVGESTYEESWTATTPNPAIPAYVGAISPVQGKLTHQGSATRTGVTAEGAGKLSFKQFDYYADKQLVSRLAEDGSGTWSLVRATGVPGDLLGMFNQSLNLPMVPISPSGSAGPQIAYGLQVVETGTLNQGKLLSRSQGLFLRNGSPIGTIARFVDPPIALVQGTIGKPPVVTQLPTTYGDGTTTGGGWGPDWDAGTAAGVGAAGGCIYYALVTIEVPPVSLILAGVCGIAAILATEY